ncbi:MAG: hypothetical protein MI747_14350, partial [Desulfobacterales bacterium]|nr:hypothetical protein [Desulfobacterales bacterium]
ITAFQGVAGQGFDRVALDQQGQGLEAGKRTGFFGRLSENRALHSAFKTALKEKFGPDIARQSMRGVGRFRSLSSRRISTILNRAEVARNKSRLAQLAQNRGGTPALAPRLQEGLRMVAGQDRVEGNFNVVDRAKPGYRGDDPIGPGDLVGGFEFVKLKDKGVEPGFVGRLPWDDSQTADLRRVGNPLNDKAKAFLMAAFQGPVEGRDPSIQDALISLARDYTQEPDLGQDGLGALLADDDGFRTQAANTLIGDDNCLEAIKDGVREKHYIKLDYAESDHRLGLKGRLVQVPKERSKGACHRFFTAKTRASANANAVKEALASDLMRAMGMESQKAHLIHTTYADGGSKLLLEAAHMEKEVDGVLKNFSDFAGRLVDGYLVETDISVDTQGRPKNPDQVRDPAQPFRSDGSLTQLGRNKIFMLALADRDAVGSRGDNKGRMGDTFAAIDPGHSLENLMGFRNVHSDFSCDDKLGGKFKNFSIFDDSSYGEKFAGVRQLAAMRDNGSDLEVFQGYREWISGEIDRLDAGGPQEPEGRQIKKKRVDLEKLRDRVDDMTDAWVQRRDYILDEVFGERLLVPEDDFSVVEGLDLLEKITGKARRTSPGGKVELSHLQLQGKRQEWHVAQNEATGGYLLYADVGKSGEGRLNAFLQSQDPDLSHLVSRDSKRVFMDVPSDQMEAFGRVFQEAGLIDHKVNIGEIQPRG